MGSCRNGHERTPENTRRRPDGKVRCLACQRIRDTEYRARNRRVARARVIRGPWPGTPRPATAAAHLRNAAERIEEIEFMLDGGVAPTWGSWPWGNSAESLVRFLYRRSRLDLAHKFATEAKRRRITRERTERRAA